MSTIKETNQAIRAAIDSFQIDDARKLLSKVIKDGDTETYFLASLVALDEKQKINFLQQALTLNPFYEPAYTALQSLENRLPEDVSPKPIYDTQFHNLDLIKKAQETPNTILMVTAKLKGNETEVKLHRLPSNSSLVISTVNPNVLLIVWERDDYGKWLRVIYQSVVGNKLGWIDSRHLDSILVKDQPIDITEIPISNYALHTRQEIKQLISYKPYKGSIGCYLFGIPALAVAMVGLFSIFSQQPLSIIVLLIGTAFGLGTIAYVLLIYSKGNEPLRMEVERLDTIARNLRSEYETMRDDQRIDLALKSALDLGGTLASSFADRLGRKGI